jgi:hypothetical protein
MPLWLEIGLGVSPLIATTIGGIWYLARLFGDFDRRLSVLEARFEDHKETDRTRQNTGEFPALTAKDLEP